MLPNESLHREYRIMAYSPAGLANRNGSHRRALREPSKEAGHTVDNRANTSASVSSGRLVDVGDERKVLRVDILSLIDRQQCPPDIGVDMSGPRYHTAVKEQNVDATVMR